MTKFRKFSKYKLELYKMSDGRHNLKAESEDGLHLVQFIITPDQALDLLTKGGACVEGRVNGTVK